MYEVTDEELTVLTNLTELGSAGSQPLFPDFNLLPDSWNQAEFINGESCDTGFQFLAFLTCPDYSSEDSGIYNMADSTSIDQTFPQFTELLDAVTTHSKNSDQPVLQERRVCGEQDKETNISKVKSFQGNRKERNRKRGKGSIASHSVHLWEFVRDLLLSPQKDQNVVRWEDRKEGTFRVVCSEMFARLWGEKKQNKCMNYEKLSRALRHYYKSGILERVDRRLTYKFGEKAYGWKEDLAL